MADTFPQNQVSGTGLAMVSITLPSLTGTGSLLSTLIAAGTDQSTASAPTTAVTDSVIGVMLMSHTGSYHLGTISTSTGTMNVTILSGVNFSLPTVNAHRVTFAKSSVASTMPAIAVCLLK